VEIDYQDTIRIISTTVDEYGNEIYADETSVAAVFEQNTGFRHSASQDGVSANVVAFVDPADDFIVDNFYRLEGMLAIAELFGVGVTSAWYRITSVTVARASQLDNEIDNIQLVLKKTAGLTGVS
jgi:hypothetical protein